MRLPYLLLLAATCGCNQSNAELRKELYAAEREAADARDELAAMSAEVERLVDEVALLEEELERRER